MPDVETGAGSRRHPWRSILPLLVASLLVVQGATAQAPDTTTVTGIVVEAGTGEPVPGALVSMQVEDWGVMTSADGAFLLPGVPEGQTTLEVTALGYADLLLTQPVLSGMEPLRVELQPDPILLDGIRVMADRFETRRKAAAVSVRAFDREELRYAPTDVVDFLRYRAAIPLTFCNGGLSRYCVLSRGRYVTPSVYIDEVRAVGGLEELEGYPSRAIFLVEVYSRGRHIRVYTNQYMERRGNAPVFPIPLWW